MINSRYEIIKQLGEGRSKVYLCNDIDMPGENFAIKILPSDSNEYEKEIFIKEYFTLRKLEHSNIIKAFEFGTIFKTDGEEGIKTGSSFIILEHFDGEVLLSSKPNIDESNLKEILKQICAALYYLHQSKYIYYDLKPDNVLVSFILNTPQIRLIDLGLAEYSPSQSEYEIKGTAHYIAPELLKKEKHNYSVDYYSLGIIAYQLIYNKLPFAAKNELEIYKAALENDFSFPESKMFSKDLVNVVKKMLEKDVSKRYSSALSIIHELGFELNIELTKEFLPARIYSSKENVIKELSQYIDDEENNAVYAIKGFEGVGKTSLLDKLLELNQGAVLISDVKGKSVPEIIRYILKKILFSASVFTRLTESDKLYLLKQIETSSKDIIDEFKSSMVLISANCKFTLLIDDFNLSDQLVNNLLLEVIPILQVNNVRLVFGESSEHAFISNNVNNLKEITLGPFTGKELITFLEHSFYSDFPTETLKDLIIKNADLIPGNIKSFINDLILFGIMIFTEQGVTFSKNEEKLTSISEAHFAVYDLRLANLSNQELLSSQVLSSFDIYIDNFIFSEVLEISEDEIQRIIYNLQLNNIIQKPTTGQTLIFISEALKKYIYASIEDKNVLHSNIALKLTEKFPTINQLELARHFELAGDFENCYKVTMEEIKDAEKHSAYSYIQKVLEHLVELPLKKEQVSSAKLKLGEVYLKLGDVQSSLNILNELKVGQIQAEIEKQLFILEGSALIASGDYAGGKKLISSLLKKLNDPKEKDRLKVELAYADFELKRYNDALEQSKDLLNGSDLSAEFRGRCYNLNGMINIYQNNDLKSALENFKNAKKWFVKSNQPIRISGAEVNIGNVYNILSDFEKAEKHWQNASHINQSMGNLEQEGILLQSLGTFYYYRGNFDFSIKSYIKAKKIFLSLGVETSIGQIFMNLGEVYNTICEYGLAFNTLQEAKKLFLKQNNHSELLEALFLSGKLNFNLGLMQSLKETINEFDKYHKLIRKQRIFELEKMFLLQMLSALNNSRDLSLEDLVTIRGHFAKLKDDYNYVETTALILNCLAIQKKFDAAIDELNKQELIELCSQNSILEAQREYFLGIISKNSKSDKLLPPLVYFEKAYDLIKDEYISEFTWKILFEISELYIDRGNLTKAKYFVTYTRELIYHIAEKIESPHLRAAYLRNQERINILKKLESFYPSN